MELKDFVVTPIVLFIVYVLAYIIRPKVTDPNTRRYFIPALTVKIIGAIAVGLIYQFYYGGGDTFAFYERGSSIIYEAFFDSPLKGIKLLLAKGEFDPSTFHYSSRIYHYYDSSSYFVVKVAAFLGLLTFNTYSAIAVLFALLSFTGGWAMYYTFYHKFESLHLALAISILFIPSVFFWGSGILKDTITLGALGWATFALNKISIERRHWVVNSTVLLVSLWAIFSIKKYILLAFLPAAIIWIFAAYLSKIKSLVLQLLLAPVVLIVMAVLGYQSVVEVGEGDPRYALGNIAKTAKITAYDIAFWTGREAGSTYTLGQLDGTLWSMIKLAPAAINVTLFRPYLWEVKNPLMLLSALESLILLALSFYVLFKIGVRNVVAAVKEPNVLFCLIFSLIFAFAVGVSTYNFGTLSRYKIPLMPFFATALVLLYHRSKRDKKLPEFDKTE